MTTYVGVVGVSVNSERSGSLSLTTSVPTTVSGGTTQPGATGTVTGTLKTLDGVTVALSGTVTTAGTRISVSGGGYQFDASPDAEGILTGTGTLTVSGTRTLSAPLPVNAPLHLNAQALTAGTSSLVVNAAATSGSSSPQSFCGSYSGTYQNPFQPEREAGWITFMINALPYAGNNYRINGSAPQSGEFSGPAVVAFSGSAVLSSSSVPTRISDGSMTAVVIGANLSLTGNWLGDRWSGLYGGTDPKGYRSAGTWYASPC